MDTQAHIVRHPRTGQPGLLIPEEVMQRWTEEGAAASFQFQSAIFEGEVLLAVDPGTLYRPGGQLSPAAREFLRANEFDVTRLFEAIWLPELCGHGCFYL